MSNTTKPANDTTANLAIIAAVIPRTGLIDFDEVITAEIVAGESIRIFGSMHGTTFDKTFRVGEVALVGGLNIDFFGPITAIGAKTVSLEGKRLDLYRFARLNYRFDLAKSQKRNADWLD